MEASSIGLDCGAAVPAAFFDDRGNSGRDARTTMVSSASIGKGGMYPAPAETVWTGLTLNPLLAWVAAVGNQSYIAAAGVGGGDDFDSFSNGRG